MDQSTRDKKISDLVAHKAPEELAGMVVDAQAAQDEQRDKQDRERSGQQEQSLPVGKSQSNQTQLKPGQPVTATDAEEAEPVEGALEKADHAKRKGSHK